MRMLLKVELDTEAANAKIQDGTLPQILEKALGDLRPEATYFTAMNGKRTALIVFDLAELSQIPSVAEPFFQNLNASVELLPVMSVEDLQAGLGRLG